MRDKDQLDRYTRDVSSPPSRSDTSAIPPPLTPTIHARGEAARLDAVLELVAFSAKPRPLSTSLDEMPKLIARALSADVCSIYLLEGADLVMRGNVGFTSDALGEIRMAVGTGITGLAVEYMRPMSLHAAPKHESYRHFPLLGEERFPVFLAVPVTGPNGALGALVLQRREPPPFERGEIELSAALTAPIAAIAERARLVDALRVKKVAGGSRRVTLSGRTLIPGQALGAVFAFPRPSSRSASLTAKPSVQDLTRELDRVSIEARKALEEFAKRASQVQSGPDLRFLIELETILDDARMRERVLELVGQGEGLAGALTKVGAEAMRTASRTGESYGIERAHRIAEVCEALAVLSSGVPQWQVPRHAVWIGEQITVFDLLVSMRAAAPAAVVLSGPANGPEARAVLELFGVPAVGEVGGLFQWIGDGAIALVDGDHGLVRVNPSRVEIAALRAHRHQGEQAQTAGPRGVRTGDPIL